MSRSSAKWTIIGLVLVAVIGLAFIGGIAALVGQSRPAEQGSVLEIDLAGQVAEGPATDPFRQLLAALEERSTWSLWDLRRALEAAAKDEQIAAVRLNIGELAIGWAVADEISDMLAAFRESGKPVHAHLAGDAVNDLQYFLAAAADRVWIAPEAGVMVNGLRFEIPFWRGTLDKLHIEPHVIMYKEYKSAGEPISRQEMSEHFREQLTAIGEDLQARAVERIAKRIQKATADVVSAVDLGLLTADEAKELGWVDELGYEDQVAAELRGIAGTKKYQSVGVLRYLRGAPTPAIKGDRVALLFAEGPILSTGKESPLDEARIIGTKMAERIDEATDDSEVKAIVMRVDSPGGSAVGSDYVWRAVKRAQEAGKPVVVSMSTVAGSGGYWISMAADKIVAQPTTITGSIGVVFAKLDVRGLYGLIGSNISDVTLAKNADLMSSFEPLKPDHEQRWRHWMDHVYGSFIKKVADGRHLSPEAVEAIAKGRIWSGVDAKENGLVDELGGLDRAIALARELGKLPATAPVQIYPRPKSFFAALSEVGNAGLLARRPDLASLLTVGFGATDVGQVRAAGDRLLLESLGKPQPWVLMPSVVGD
ncbi:MAG: signal peptide peptidase SppA [Candidatus Schekmanbacteria bacterium]|nr:signal peptide peptidase SppA [Candidatus Schekmanbacteria bacterium]